MQIPFLNSAMSLFVSKEIEEKRMEKCRKCISFDEGKNRCRECGCFLAIKAKLNTAACPSGKW